MRENKKYLKTTLEKVNAFIRTGDEHSKDIKVAISVATLAGQENNSQTINSFYA
jgi:hypothetical protein